MKYKPQDFIQAAKECFLDVAKPVAALTALTAFVAALIGIGWLMINYPWFTIPPISIGMAAWRFSIYLDEARRNRELDEEWAKRRYEWHGQTKGDA